MNNRALGSLAKFCTTWGKTIVHSHTDVHALPYLQLLQYSHALKWSSLNKHDYHIHRHHFVVFRWCTQLPWVIEPLFFQNPKTWNSWQASRPRYGIYFLPLCSFIFNMVYPTLSLPSSPVICVSSYPVSLPVLDFKSILFTLYISGILCLSECSSKLFSVSQTVHFVLSQCHLVWSLFLVFSFWNPDPNIISNVTMGRGK